jgi:transposase
MFATIFKERSTLSVRIHAVYACEKLNFPQYFVAHVFGKSPGTISRWVSEFRETGTLHDGHQSLRFRRLTPEHHDWIVNYVQQHPLSLLDEIRAAFEAFFKFAISVSSIWRVLSDANITKKVIERRALEISQSDIARFTYDVNLIAPLHRQLLFLDEVSTDNRSLLRKRGWFVRGQRPVYRGVFRRGSRMSFLCFLGVDGIVEAYQTPDTFNRLTFFEKCKVLLDSGRIQMYPGQYP